MEHETLPELLALLCDVLQLPGKYEGIPGGLIYLP